MNLGKQPITKDFLKSADKKQRLHPLSLHILDECGFVQQPSGVPKELVYDKYRDLGNWQPQPHMSRLVELIEELPGISSGIGSKLDFALDVLCLPAVNAERVQRIQAMRGRSLKLQRVRLSGSSNASHMTGAAVKLGMVITQRWTRHLSVGRVVEGAPLSRHERERPSLSLRTGLFGASSTVRWITH